MGAAVLLAMWLRRRMTRNFWIYVVGPGTLSWGALYLSGFHPALALVPIVPFMPHSSRDAGLFDPREERRPRHAESVCALVDNTGPIRAVDLRLCERRRPV
jgi:hypothetical protein